MPTWGDLLREIAETRIDPENDPTKVSPWDMVRRKYLALTHEHTGRATILYATRWTQPRPGEQVPPAFITITDEDVPGFMEAVHGLEGPNLDLILHSPGGSPGAAEAVVSYLRSKFDHIRVIVPHMAMSAATMIACAADEIIMGKHSFLGPIDPQMVLNTSLGQRMVPAQAIIQQFELAKDQCKDPTLVRAWLPMLSQFGPDLLVSCQNASDLAEELVREWLAAYMFRESRRPKTKARQVAKWLSTHSHFKSHGRPIPRAALLDQGLNVVALEDDQVAQDLFLSVFHAAAHTFAQTGATKIIENHHGKAFIKMIQVQRIAVEQVLVQAEPSEPKSDKGPQEAPPAAAKRATKRKGTARKKSKNA